MSYFTVDIFTPNRVLVKELEASSVIIPTLRGEIKVLPEHTHLVAQLDTGVCTIVSGEGKETHFSMTTGICKILDKKITLLPQVSEGLNDIDKERAEKALARAEEKLKSKDSFSDLDLEKYRRKVDRARMRLRMLSIYK